MSDTPVNRLSCALASAPGLAGSFIVGAAQVGFRTFDAAHDTKTFTVVAVAGTAWEVRSGCAYTHSTSTLSRGSLEDSSTGSAIDLDATTVLSVVMSAAQAQSLITGPFTASQVSAINGKFNLTGISKHFGANLGGSATFNVTNLSADGSHGYKIAADAPFIAVRLVHVNRGPNTLTGFRMTVAVSETADASSNSNASQPIINGVTYGQAAPAGTVNGHIPVTWGGSVTTPALVGSATAATYQISDRIPITSVPRADVPSSNMHLLIVRCDSAGLAGTPAAVQTSVLGASALQTISAANRGKTLTIFGGTALALTPANVGIPGNSTNRHFEVFPIFEYAQPAWTVMQVGDSTDQMDAIVAGVYNNWGWRACVDASTTSRAFSYVNEAASSRDATEYWARAKELFAAGIVPNVLVIQPASLNDDFTQAAPNTVLLKGRARAAEIATVAKQYGIKHVCFRPIFPNSALTSPQDAFRQAWNVWLQTFAAAVGVYYLPMTSLSGGILAGVEQWAAGMNYDLKHPSELAADTVLAPLLRDWLRTLA